MSVAELTLNKLTEKLLWNSCFRTVWLLCVGAAAQLKP